MRRLSLNRRLLGGRDRSDGGFPNAGYEPHPLCGDRPLTARSRPKSAAKISRKIVAGQQYLSRMVETLSGTVLYRGLGRLLQPRPGRLQRTCRLEILFVASKQHRPKLT